MSSLGPNVQMSNNETRNIHFNSITKLQNGVVSKVLITELNEDAKIVNTYKSNEF